MKKICTAGFILLLALSGAADARHHKDKTPKNQAGVFDYYALSLSWAPNFCSSHSDPGECGTDKHFGFVLHGLWPQYVNGYPQSCSTEKLSAALKDKYGPIFASPDLINHEWPKHGTCSGLPAEQYLELTAKLKDGLVIPQNYQQPAAPVRVTNMEFAQAFKAANPSLADGAILPFCVGGGRFLQEVHACYDKSGASLSCSASETHRSQSSCGKASFLLQNVK